MLKKISFILVLIIITSLVSVSVFADGDKSDKKETANKKDTTEKSAQIISITKPFGDGEKTFCKPYTICGITDKENIRIQLFKKKSDGTYSEFKSVDGESSWDVGTSGDSSGFFSIDISLSSGYKNPSTVNSFKIYAYDKTNPDYNQTCNITITFLDATKSKSDITDYSLDKILKPLK